MCVCTITVTVYGLITFMKAGSTNRTKAFYGCATTWLIEQSSIKPTALGVVDYIYLDLGPIRANTVQMNVTRSEKSQSKTF